MTEEKELKVLVDMAELLADCARVLAKQHGVDLAMSSSACGFAGTKLLWEMAGGDKEKAMQAAKIYSESGLRSMADIVSGQETEHGTAQ